MKKEILEVTDIESKEINTVEVEDKKINKKKREPIVEKSAPIVEKSVPIVEKKKEPKKTKYIYKITNKTFQPIQLVINENDMVLLGSRKQDNVAFVKIVTNQITNLEKKGMVKIRKMS